jgi:hypothetical protein
VLPSSLSETQGGAKSSTSCRSESSNISLVVLDATTLHIIILMIIMQQIPELVS